VSGQLAAVFRALLLLLRFEAEVIARSPIGFLPRFAMRQRLFRQMTQFKGRPRPGRPSSA
jgi:hypothetical protein